MTGKRWTNDEEIVLRRNYGIHPIREWIDELPGRTWDSIQTKSTRMGLVSYLGGRSPKPKFIPHLPEVEEMDFEQLWETSYAFQKASRKLSSRQDEITIELDVDYPIGVPFLADAHIGAVSAPLDYIRTRFEMVAENPRFYPFSVGDTIDNYLPASHPQGMFGTMFPPELQKELVLNLYLKIYGRWLAVVQGCHEEFSHSADDFDFTKYLAHQLGCANLGFGGVVNLKVGEQIYRIALRHKYRFNSSYNPTHCPKQLVRFEYPNADIACVAHNHRAACEQLSHRDKDRIYVRPGSFKGPDRYARSLGFTDTGSAIPVVILWPDKRQMLPFLHLEQAIEVLNSLGGE